MKVSAPAYCGSGVYRTTPATSVVVPFGGWLTAVTDSTSPVSGAPVSLASTPITLSTESSATVGVSVPATGGSLTEVTVTLTVAVALPPWPSEIV